MGSLPGLQGVSAMGSVGLRHGVCGFVGLFDVREVREEPLPAPVVPLYGGEEAEGRSRRQLVTQQVLHHHMLHTHAHTHTHARRRTHAHRKGTRAERGWGERE